MVSNTLPLVALPEPRYVDLRFEDGTHSGVRVDLMRGIIEVQKRGVKHVFDLVMIQESEQRRERRD